MKSFLLSMVLGVGSATVVAVVVTRALFPAETGGQQTTTEQPRVSPGEFTQFDAVEVVVGRLESSPRADRLRHNLRHGAWVEYHSPGHWTVRLNDASWTAHRVGSRYAEPDNEAARRYEQEAAGS